MTRTRAVTDGPDPIDVAVGARVRFRRKHLRMSQSALAEALGLTFQQVQKYERGANRISASVLVKIAAALETSVGALIGENEGDGQSSSIYQFFSKPGTVDLLQAFSHIDNTKVQNAVDLPPEKWTGLSRSALGLGWADVAQG